MGRRRTKDKDLPQRVYRKNGAFHYVDRKNKWHWLAPLPDKNPMYTAFAKFFDKAAPMHTMNDVFDRFIVEKLPALAERTQSDYLGYIENLRLYFGDAPPEDPTAGDIFDYRNKRAERSIVQANREKSCLSSIFTAAIEWKLRTDNPCKLVPKLHEVERNRYVEDWEYLIPYNLAPSFMQEMSGEMMRGMMELATMTGQREGDLLRLPMHDARVYTPDGIKFKPNKSKRKHPRHGQIIETSKTVIIEWSPELTALVEHLRSIGPQIRPTLICTQDGTPYTESGFRSNWHRLMTAATKPKAEGEPPPLEWFTFHDLRAKRASDDDDVMIANQALGHDDLKTTQRIYRRKPRRARAGAKILDSAADIRQDTG